MAIPEVTDDSFDTEVLQHAGIAIVDFWSMGCAPCRILLPLLEEVVGELGGKIKALKLDCDDNDRTTSQLGIRGLPTLIVFKNGQEFDRAIGLQSKTQLRNWLTRCSN
jgi:thioredoxin 1